jgi:proteasome assembly chaperone (PAC2) family protein
MQLLRLDLPLPTDLRSPVLLMALDGWTDAGEGGTRAARELLEQLDGVRLGDLDPDLLYDYRDRRPVLEIERGVLGTLDWPNLELHVLRPPDGPDLVLLLGAEPDLGWRRLSAAIIDLAATLGITRCFGLGAVPGPLPHTRTAKLIVTSTDESMFDRFGRPREEVVVPASCQVALEREFGAAGLAATGFWVRVPHYVATDYPEASRVLLRTLASLLGIEIADAHLEPEIERQRTKLDEAAAGSPEVGAHIKMLEEAYDADLSDDEPIRGPIPTGDQIAAEFERFLRDTDS